VLTFADRCCRNAQLRQVLWGHAMQTLVDSYAQSILDTIRDVKPVKVTYERPSYRYRCGRINDDCMRVAHFLHDLTDNRDYYGSCLLTKNALCGIIKFVTGIAVLNYFFFKISFSLFSCVLCSITVFVLRVR